MAARHGRKSRLPGRVLLLMAVLSLAAGVFFRLAPVWSTGEGPVPVEERAGEVPDAPFTEPELLVPEEEVAEDISVPQGPYIAILIDDFGFSRKMAEDYARVAIPLTWAVIPFQSASEYAAKTAEEAGIPYLVHMPMAAAGDSRRGKKSGVLDSGMTQETITLFVRRALEALPGAVGVNNHRGSRATGDGAVMKTLMAELEARSLLFVDSRTTTTSVAYSTAVETGVEALYNSIFLDNEATESSIREQFQRGLSLARKRGWVVMIGHARPTTLAFIQKQTVDSLSEGTFVTVPRLVNILSGQQPTPSESGGTDVMEEGEQ